MAAKLAVVILAFGLIAAGLLSTRQSRLQAAHEVTAARLRVRAHDERLLKLRAEIAELVTPESVRQMLEESGEIEHLAPLADRVYTEDSEQADTQQPQTPQGGIADAR
ncbi:MAG: hypothetical protein H6810_02790 [Phycisphaeraceae bacterium]|nr:MAG: hypothetical protein H6810_02790 [Phycisphaeraceae bacterium]